MEKVHEKAADAFREQGFSVIRKTKLSPEELAAIIPTVHVIGIRSKTKLPKEILEKATNLMAVGCFCIGTDTTDLPLAANMGIPVFNSPYANSRSVAELVIAEMVMLARQTGDRSMECHKGTWNKQSAGCYEIRGKTLGIIGYGHVGSQLSVLAEAMGMRVVFYDVVPKLSLGNASQCKSIDDLLKQSMFVSLHVPNLPSTVNMMRAEQFAMMPKGAYMLNLSRGKVVDVEALAASLKAGHLAGSAVDVYPLEPAGLTHDFKTPLQGCPNTILTPHIGGSTEEAQEAIGLEVSSKLISYINNGNTTGSVNVPIVAPAGRLKSGCTRVISFHKNVPGVMRDMNMIMSEANVTFQALSTNEEIGYLIADIGSKMGKELKEKLNALPATLRNYVLYEGEGYQGEFGE